MINSTCHENSYERLIYLKIYLRNLSLKKEGNLTQATAWVNLEDFMLSEIYGSQKDSYSAIPLI